MLTLLDRSNVVRIATCHHADLLIAFECVSEIHASLVIRLMCWTRMVRALHSEGMTW